MTLAAIDPRTPVVIGVGQVNVDEDAVDVELEPVDQIERAARLAAEDAGAPNLLPHIDAVRIVAIMSWRYRNPGALVAERIGATEATTEVSPLGGNSPQMLVNRTALDIAAGHNDLVVIGGAESLLSRNRFRREDALPPWSNQDDSVPAAPVLGQELDMSHSAEINQGIVMPVQAYPILETAVRSASGRSPAEHLDHIASLWSRLSQVAAGNPHAAVRRHFTAQELQTPTPDNRWIGYPYTKWMCSNDRVEQAAALVMCSVERARDLGISPDRWVFPLAGTDTTERTMSLRHDLSRSPAIAVGGRRALELAGVDVDDLAHIDLYSCFPSAVQIAAHEMGIGLDRGVSVTGGLTFAGGPWNNYVTHSIATMVDLLRDEPGAIGLCTANGGLISKHSFGLYSTTPPTGGFRHDEPQAEVDAAPSRPVSEDYQGEVTVEAYTVMHNRDGADRVLAATLNPDGERRWAHTTDADLIATFMAEEVCGQAATVTATGELSLAD